MQITPPFNNASDDFVTKACRFRSVSPARAIRATEIRDASRAPVTGSYGIDCHLDAFPLALEAAYGDRDERPTGARPPSPATIMEGPRKCYRVVACAAPPVAVSNDPNLGIFPIIAPLPTAHRPKRGRPA